MKRRPVASLIEPLEGRVHLSVTRPVYNTGTGFFVDDGQVYDANGNPFVIRGINQNQWWGNATENFNAIDHVAKTGSNAVRAVFFKDLEAPSTSGSDTPAERRAIVEEYLANNIVPIVEDHGATENENNAINDPAALAETVDNWLDPANVDWLQDYEQQVILNIANEWGPAWSATNHVWRDSYITQVQRLRNAGIDNLIMIDAGGWGQDINTIKNDAQAVLDADPQHNIVFSIHFYSQWRTEDRSFDLNASTFDAYTQLSAVQSLGLPIVVGEFSWEGLDFATYRTRRILQICEQLDIGYLGWGWNHNSPAGLNMLVDNPLTGTVEWQYNSNTDLTAWGDTIINDADYGIKATSVRASIFPAEVPRLILEKTTVNVAETGTGLARVRLSAAPASNVTVNLSKVTGDTNLTLGGATSLLFTPSNWDEYQPILLSGSADADTTVGTARFQLAASGLQSIDFVAKEIDSGVPTGTFTLTPTDDRDTQSDAPAGTNATVSASKWNHFFMRFDLSGVGGKASSATLRVYKSQATSNLVGRAWLSMTDTWTQAGATPPLAFPVLSRTMPNGTGYVDFDVTGIVNDELRGDRAITLAITTNSDGWTSFNTKEAAAGVRPQLVVNATEAIPPRLVSSSFDHLTNANRLRFTFTENVSASLSSADVLLESLTDPGASLTLSATPAYDVPTQTASFLFTPGIVPNGNYRATLLAPGVTDAASNALLLNSAIEFYSLAGDANRDRHVDEADLAIVNANLGQSNRTFAQGDFNYSGTVDSADVAILNANWHMWLPAQGPITLPGSAGPDTFRVRRESATLLSVHTSLTDDASPLYRIPVGAITSLSITGASGDDVLAVDYSNGLPIPVAGISIDGGGGIDTLAIVGTAGADDVTIDADSVQVGGQTTPHTGIEGLKFDGRGGWDNLAVAGALPLELAHEQRLQLLSVTDGASASMLAGGNTLVVRDLVLGPTASLNLADNDLLWDYSGDTPYERAKGYVVTGRNTGTYGILWTVGAGDRVLAVAEAALLGRTSWNGIPLDGAAIVGKYTYYGDANMDGKVTSDDYVAVDVNLGGVNKQWIHGDFNFDGNVTSDEYVAIDVNLGKGSPAPATIDSTPAVISEADSSQVADDNLVEEVQTTRRRDKSARPKIDRRRG